jgi:hypothetical protein
MKFFVLATLLAAAPALAQSITYQGEIAPGTYIEAPQKTFPKFAVSITFDFVRSVRAHAEAFANRYYDDDAGDWKEFCVTRMVLPQIGTVHGSAKNLTTGVVSENDGIPVQIYYIDGAADGTGPGNCRTKPFVTGRRPFTVNAVLGRFRTGANYLEVAIAPGVPTSSFTLNALGNDDYELVLDEVKFPATSEVVYSVYDTANTGPGLNSKEGKAVLGAR